MNKDLDMKHKGKGRELKEGRAGKGEKGLQYTGQAKFVLQLIDCNPAL